MRIENCPVCLGEKMIYNGVQDEICPRCLGEGEIQVDEMYDYYDQTDEEPEVEPYDEIKHYKKGDEL